MKNEYPMQTWRNLQKRHEERPETPFVLLLLLVTSSFLLPILAWGEELSIPVLKHELTVGSIIQAADVEMRTVDERRVSPRVMRRKAELVGKEMHRRARPGVPVYDSYVRVPPAISKNSLVDVIYKAEGLTLKGTGKALEDAPAGQTIRFMNIDSGRTLAGLVQQDGTLLVQ